MLVIPRVILCPRCDGKARRHCDPDIQPDARCNWFICCPSNEGCGFWTEVSIGRYRGLLKWVQRKVVYVCTETCDLHSWERSPRPHGIEGG